MKVLALEPYFGGSHKAFLEGWSAHSRYEWTILGLPAYKWKWRMRHAAITFAEQVRKLRDDGKTWDLVLTCDMLNLAEFRGLADTDVARLPAVVYFHENQLTYPVREARERDYHFAFTNLITALAADGVWFNSAYHRDDFLAALREFLTRMPDYQTVDAVETIRQKSAVHPPGIDPLPPRGKRRAGPLRILWAARWEHDKDPETFFAALQQLKSRGVPFRVSVIGESFRETPAVFARAREAFADQIDRWGYQPRREDYVAALHDADVVVSTARHEFFGLSVVEAIDAGAYPLLPRRLSYPEVLDIESDCSRDAAFFYDDDGDALAGRLEDLAVRMSRDEFPRTDCDLARLLVKKFHWPRLAPQMDDALMFS